MKNGKFVGKVNRQAREGEVRELLKEIEGLPINEVEVRYTEMGVIVDAKLDRPVYSRLRNYIWVENLTKIRIYLWCRAGFETYEESLKNEGKELRYEEYPKEQYSVNLTTNGTMRGYRCRNKSIYEGRGHYTYDTEIKEMGSYIREWFNNL